MNAKSLLIAPAIAVGLAMLANAQQATTKEQLIGTWKVVSLKATTGNDVSNPFGEKVAGYVTYTTDRIWVLIELMFYIIVILAAIIGGPAFAQGVDPLIGTWKLNVEKSTSTVPLPKSLILAFAGEGQTLTDTADLVDDQGRASKIVFRHIYDGMSHPTTGNPPTRESATP
jgi:hypothetical protein